MQDTQHKAGFYGECIVYSVSEDIVVRRKRYRVFLIFLMVMIPGLSGCTAKTSMAGNTIPKSTAGSGDSVYESKAREYEGSEANDEIRNVMKNMAANTERVSCSHDGVELAIEIPDGWSHRICSAEECDELDGMMKFGITFWPNNAPEIELSYGHYDFIGVCGTGVTIEEIMLDSGMKAWKYTEAYNQEHKMWMSVILEAEGWTPKDGSCMVECFVDLDQWSLYEDTIMKIAKSVEVS